MLSVITKKRVTYVVLIVLIFLIFTTVIPREIVNADIATGLVGYFPFDGDFNDYGSGGNNATQHGGMSLADGSEVQIIAGSGLYGINAFSGLVKTALAGGVLIHDDCDGDTGNDYYCNIALTAAEIFNTASNPIDSLRMEWEIGVSPDAQDGTGTYTDELTFIASATF